MFFHNSHYDTRTGKNCAMTTNRVHPKKGGRRELGANEQANNLRHHNITYNHRGGHPAAFQNAGCCACQSLRNRLDSNFQNRTVKMQEFPRNPKT